MTLKSCAVALLTTGLALLAGAQSAAAQSQLRSGPTIRLGPRLLEYRIECLDSDSCRLQCFQHGTQVFDRANIDKADRLHLFASTGANDEIIPRWIEIRPANGKQAQSLLLSSDTTCDLNSLRISPNPEP